MSDDDLKTLHGPASGAEAIAQFSARPRVEITRNAKGEAHWRISVVAADDSEVAIRQAARVAREIDDDLNRYLRSGR